MLDHILEEYMSPDHFPTIIEFAEAPWGWNQHLLPTQKFIFKLIYGLPLDKSTRSIRITDKFNEHCYERLSEFDYFKFLATEGRINLDTPPEKPMHLIVEAIGRRGSKSTMASILGGYELYRLLNLIKDPHNYYGITQKDEIRVLLVSNAKDQAEIIYNQIKEGANNCERLSKYISNDTKEKLIFFTPAQLEMYKKDNSKPLRERKGLLSAFIGTSNSRNIRGAGCITMVLDEFAHFITNSGVKSDSAVYEAISPAAAMFGTQAKKVLISSPWAKTGKFWELYNKGMNIPEMKKTTLVLRIPTWGMNEKVEPDYLRSEYLALGKTSYQCEYGAVFSDSKSGWITDDTIVSESLITNMQAPIMGKRHVRYFWTIDQASKADAFGIAIGHQEDDNIIVDYAKDYYADPEERKRIKAKGFEPAERYQFTNKLIQYPHDHDEMADELLALSRRFPIAEGIMDQWSGVLLQQIFEKKGIKNFSVVNFTDKLNSDIYQMWYLIMSLGQFKMYEDAYLVNQILSLEEDKRSKGIKIVQAPDMAGMHDDLSDAIARLVWLILQGPGSEKDKKKRRQRVRGAYIGGGAHIGQSMGQRMQNTRSLF